MDFYNKKKITRRKFIKGVAGAAVCCACFPLDRLAASEEDSEQDGEGKVHLAAACGTYCGACPAYINKYNEGEKNFPSELPTDDYDLFINYMNNLLCDGCLSGGTLAGHCQNCNIRLHALDTQNNYRCSDCVQLPCYRITNLINQAPGYPHRQEYLPNLAKMREMGVEEWVKYEEARWSCPRCGLPISWYDTRCAWCGAPRSWRLFPLSENGNSSKGDIDGNGIVDLPDSILALQVCANTDMYTSISVDMEANGDGRIGLEEVIYILQKLSI